ncbi:TetR/AcrR family transcriptional regulator [Leucobacter sp. NPDC058333]|uniref:TetR/AcrR family transcriptional regulator n=1 Tax=Leucobacter sp. NPDC058333 TaxID=3346450 RepID=UPI003659B44E
MSPRDAAPTRVAIIGAASTLLERGGVEAVTLRGVGEEAGISRAAPYRHFADKAALLQYLAVHALHSMAQAVRQQAARADPSERVLAGSLAYVEYAIAHPKHYLLIFGDAPRVEAAPDAEAAADDAMQSIEELIAERDAITRIDSATDRDPIPVRERATVLWITLHGIAQLQITGHLHEPRTLDGNTRLAELVELAVRTQLRA